MTDKIKSNYTSQHTKIVTGIIIIVVIGLIVIVNNYITPIQQKVGYMLDIAKSYSGDSFANTKKNMDTSLTIYNQAGSVPVIANNKVFFYRADDYHQIQIVFNNATDMSTFLNMSTSSNITVSLIDLNNKLPTQTKTYNITTQYNDLEINTEEKKLIFKYTLIEKTNYNIIVETPTHIIDKSFTTDANTFYYGTLLNNTNITSAINADKNMCLGIKLSDDTTYKYNTADANTLNNNKTPIRYILRKPNLSAFKNNLLTTANPSGNTTTREYAAFKQGLEDLDKYIPYKFDITLDFVRPDDSFPLEVVKSPPIDCIDAECELVLSNLRAGITYTLNCRLIYIKLGSANNYRSTPELRFTYTPSSSDNTFETLEQIKNLLSKVKQQSIDINNFNKYQVKQDSQLANMEAYLTANT